MKIGITGISGYIGSHLATRCREAGHEVIGYSRSNQSGMRKLENGVGDFSGLDALVLLGHEPIFGVWTPQKAKRVWDSRVDVTRRIRERLAELEPEDRPRVLVSSSGIAYYGDRGDEQLPEDASKGESEYFSDLVEAWEAEVTRASDLGIRPVCARIGVVLGEGSPACAMFAKVFGLGLGGKLGSGQQWFSWIATPDLVTMLETAITDESLTGPVNFVSPSPVRNLEMTREIGNALNRPTLIPAPAFGVKLAFRELSQALLYSQRVEPKIWKERGFEWQVPTIDSAFEVAFKS